MNSKGKILIYLLMMVMIVNAVGIAQVSHICKLAVTGMEAPKCSDDLEETHACCNTESEQLGFLAKKNNCCTDVVKYYHQKINTTLQSVLKLNIQNFYISLFTYPVPKPVLTTITNFFSDVYFIPVQTGTSIVINLHSLLI